MRIAGRYSFNGGADWVSRERPHLLEAVTEAIGRIDEAAAQTKVSEERGSVGELFYSPSTLNSLFKKQFARLGGWHPRRVSAEYSVAHYEPGYRPKRMNRGAFREMDFVKEDVGVEVQFGKYAFMVYNVCAKMTIFKNLGHIRAGIEIVPVRSFVERMSSGVSYFEQFVWDLETRGVSNIDTPVLVLGIAADWERASEQRLPEQLVHVSKRRLNRGGAKPGPK